jgi:hypothetical protein
MQHFRRLAWLFLCGFVVAAGVSVALALASLGVRAYVKSLPETYKPPNPKDYQPPQQGEMEFSDVSFIEITTSAGIQGSITNRSKRPVTSFRVDVDFKRKESLLYSCSETVVTKVEPGATKRFQFLCDKVDRRALTGDIVPHLKIGWVYHGDEK